MVLPVNISYIDSMGGATPETSAGFELTYSNKQKYRNLAKISCGRQHNSGEMFLGPTVSRPRTNLSIS